MKSGDLNYNAYSHKKIDYMAEKRWEEDSEFEVNFVFEKGSGEWDYYVTNNSSQALKGKGTRIPNFIDPPAGTQIDPGAVQKGVWSMCVGPTADCANQPTNPPPAEPLPEPTDLEPVLATYAPFYNQMGASFYSAPKTFWATAPSYTFRHRQDQASHESDNEVTLKAIWDQDYLSVAVSVTDDEAVAVATDKAFQNDGIELLFDIKNGNASVWGGRPAEHKQFVVDLTEQTLVDPDGLEGEARYAAPNSRISAYRYEVRIPWTSLGIKPTVGTSIGFDVANNDRDNGKKTHFTYSGRDDNFLVPGKFARLELVDIPPVPVVAAAGAITVDGKLDEEDWDYGQAENGVSSYQFSVGNSLASSKMLWTPEYLYVGVHVFSEELVVKDPAKPWSNDGMEVLFDTQNNKAAVWDTAQGHKQLIVDIDGNLYKDPEASKPGSLEATVARSREVAGDRSKYFIEMAIPWSSLGVTTPQLGDTMSFDLVHNDRDTDGYQAVTLSGRTNESEVSFKTPSEFADMVLVEAFDIFQTQSAVAQTASVTLPSATAARQLTVYPNPLSGGSAQLRLSGFEAGAQVQITDTQGQVVYRQTHDQGQIQLTQRLPRGLYLVRVSDARGSLTEKLLVE